MDNLKITLQNDPALTVTLQNNQALDISLQNGSVGTRNYERLLNKPSVNGVVLLGNQTSVDLNIVSENTEAGWTQMSDYIPRNGEICYYSDTSKIKIGDGVVCLVDLPYICSDDVAKIKSKLEEHINDTTAHITAQERDFWNAKLNYDVSDEELIFTRN